MVTEKKISDWQKILIDTSILCSLFCYHDKGSKDPNIKFVYDLMMYLNKTKTSDSINRVFLISSITVSELLIKEDNEEKIRKIVKTLDNENVEFIDFDLDTALLLNRDLHEYLNSRKLNEYAASLGFKTGDFMMAREWISRDLMIIENAKNSKVDAVLTCDKKTFYPLSYKTDVFTALVYPDYFRHEHGVMLSYNHANARLDNIRFDLI